MKLHPRVVFVVAATLLLVCPQKSSAQLSPEEELKSLDAAPGIEVSLFASEPLITNPSAIDIDSHGRVWVAEIQWYRAAAKDPPGDKIKVLEDTDGDGRADKATVFADGVFAPMSICVAGHRVYVATSPDLWMYEDRDGDLVADGPPEKLLTGFGGFNHDHGAHSLVLGPDHKWWMSHGDTGFDVTGTDGSHIQFQWGAMLRGELDGSKLETVAVNFRNPYEISVSSFGEAFCSDNDNDGNFSVRICWILEGGNYGWFGGPPAKVPPGTPFGEHWHFRGHIPGFVPATLVTGFGSPCGMCFYEGDAFGDLKNAPLHTDSGPREVRIYRHEPSGAGMKATSRVFLSSESDNYFRPDDICTAPDGSLYVSDWYDGGVGGHAYNNPDQGRIFVLRPSGQKPAKVTNPGPYKNPASAILGLKSPNLATQFLAREYLLAKAPDTTAAIATLLDSDDPNYRARALWLLDRIGGKARRYVRKELNSPDAAFRALAVRILLRHGPEYAADLLPLASDPSPRVGCEVLLALRDLEGPEADDALLSLASGYDGRDRYLLEAIHIAVGERGPQLYAALSHTGKLSIDKIQLLQVLDPAAAAEFLSQNLAKSSLDEKSRAVLLAHLGGTASPEAGEAVMKLALDAKAPAELRRMSIGLLASNLPGNWQELKQRPEMVDGLRQLLADARWQTYALALVGDNALSDLGKDVLALVESDEAPADVRRKAIQVCAQLQISEAAEVLAPLVNSPDERLRAAALGALVDLQEWNVIKPLLAGAEAGESQRLTVERVMSGTGGALAMLRWIDSQAVSAAVRKQAIELATNHADSNVRVLYEQFIPEDQRPKRLGAAVKPAEILALEGNRERGSQIFFKSSAAQCRTCHRVHGLGTSLGPDLSQIGRKYERAALLETLLDPSKAIAPEYVAHLVETEDGRVFAGYIVEKNDAQVVLKDAKGELFRVAAEDVAVLAPQPKSLMPELVLRDVTAQDAADLLAYLVSLNQAVQNVTRFRALGPFASPDKQGIDHDFGPEQGLARPDLEASFDAADGRMCRWETIEAAPQGAYAAFDQVEHAQRLGLPAEAVTNYYLFFADSASDQEAALLVGSDDDCKVWVNGELFHEHRGDRILTPGEDEVSCRLVTGRNAIVMKVENNQGPGGMAVSIRTPGAVQLQTE